MSRTNEIYYEYILINHFQSFYFFKFVWKFESFVFGENYYPV